MPIIRNHMRRAGRYPVVLVVAAALAACSAPPPSFELAATVAEPEEAFSVDSFGPALALDGSTLVVGAKWDEELGTQAGTAYVFEGANNGTWSRSAKIVGSRTEPFYEFGPAVAVSGEVILVGSAMEQLERQDEGAAYVFERGGDGAWVETARLTASNAEVNAEFGKHVALVGDRALVAAPFYGGMVTPTGFRGGAVYAFERGDDGAWMETAILQPAELRPDIRYGLRFGYAIDFDGERALIGANPIEGDGQNPPGLAYVFERNEGGQWSEAALLTAPGAEGEDYFGTAVALLGDVAVVGAPGERGHGGAHIFERQADGTWTHSSHLVAPDSVVQGGFGVDVGVADSTVVVLAMASGSGSTPGHLYVYMSGSDGWSLDHRIVPDEIPEVASLLRTAALEGDRVVVDGENTNGYTEVFLFQR